jgi:hypothetical protein
MDFVKKIEDLEIIPNKFFDKFAARPLIFTLIVIFQGCFGGLGVVQTPEKLMNITNSPVARAMFVCAIAYTATSDIETAIVATLIFFIFLHFLRTDKEKKEMKTLL